MSLEFRGGTAADASAILEVVQDAFALARGSAKWRSRKALAEREPRRFRVLALDGRIIGVVHVADHRLRVGGGVVRKADVGHVSVRPQLQGRGHGSAMMARLVAWMRAEGYDLSRLGGRVSFYRRFGWVPFPRRFVEFEIRRLDGDAFHAMTARAGPGRVRAYDPELDREARDGLLREFDAGRTGAFNPGPPAAPRPIALVYEREGAVGGYLGASLSGVDHTPFEAAMQIGPVACGQEHSEALAELVKHALRLAREAGVGRVSARLPFDPRVLNALREADVGFSTQELESRPGSNMLQIINLRSLLDKLAPELEARLRESASAAWAGVVSIEADGRGVQLAIERGRVAVVEGQTPTFELRVGQAALLRLVLGLTTIDGVVHGASPGPRPVERSLLRDLFPIQPTASGPWG